MKHVTTGRFSKPLLVLTLCLFGLVLSGCQTTAPATDLTPSLNNYYVWLKKQPETLIADELDKLNQAEKNIVENKLKLAALHSVPSTRYFNPYTAKSYLNAINGLPVSNAHQGFILVMKDHLDQQILLRNEKKAITAKSKERLLQKEHLAQENLTLKKQIQQLKAIELDLDQ